MGREWEDEEGKGWGGLVVVVVGCVLGMAFEVACFS